MYSNNSNNQGKKASNGYANHTNFIEALKSAGGSIASNTVKSVKEDLIQGTGRQMVDSIFNTSSQSNNQPDSFEQPFNFSEYLDSGEARVRAQERVKYELDQTETIIFNRRQEEVKKQIENIQDELKRIAREILALDKSTQTSIFEEIKRPGIYHVNFFEKLLFYLRQLRKHVNEARHWANIQGQRTQAKSYYWQQSNNKVGGTKFSLSQERQLSTQTG
mgnify:CR=1 FL=1